MSVFITGNTRNIEIIKSGDSFIIPKKNAIVYTSTTDVGITYFQSGYSPTQEVLAFSYSAVTSHTFSSSSNAADFLQNLIDSDQSFTQSYMTFSGVTITGVSTSFINNISATTITAITAYTNYIKVNTLSANSSNTERVIIYDVQPSSYSNVLYGVGSALTYAQLNIRNIQGGSQSSSDIVATANNGDESNNYIDMGINSSNYTASYVGLANDAYLYSSANDLWIGSVTSNKKINFFTDGTGTTNIRMIMSSASTRVSNLSATTLSADTIYLSGQSIIYSGMNLGSGINIFTGISENRTRFKTISADTKRNVFINSSGDTLTISSSYMHKAFEQAGSGTTLGKRYYSNLLVYNTNANSSMAANTLRAVPLIITRTCIIDEMGINIGTSSGNNFLTIGLYDNYSAETRPGNLLKYFGSASTSGTGSRLLTGDTPVLIPGLYWATYNANTAVTINVSTTMSMDLGSTSSALGSPMQYVTWSLSATNSLPSVWSGSTSFATTVPKIYYHIKEYLDI